LTKITSESLYERAVKVIPGGVTRPLRYFDPYPFYAKKAHGSKLVDFEGKSYTDFWMGHGALVLGHLHPVIVAAAREQLKLGCHLGVCNEWEVRLAEQVTKLVPSVEMLTFSNSGNEANMHALKLARAYTKRDKIAKFEGAFHGVLDSVHVGVDWPTNKSDSAGQDPLSTQNTILLPSDNPSAAFEMIRKEQPACVLLELVIGGATVPVEKEFVKGLRGVCDETDTLLVADEVITGFRIARGGAQEAFGVTPDLTTFGKAIGGGEFPVGAVGGKAEIMERMDNRKYSDRSDLVMRGGTYVGNPLVMRAGYEATKVYEKGKFYAHIDRLGEKLRNGMQEAVDETSANAYVSGFGSISRLHLLKKHVDKHDLKTLVTNIDTQREKAYFRHLVSKGILAMTAGQVHFYISLPHRSEEIDSVIRATKEFLKSSK
jgi:glutamate-1-semialdehyde 2,1-aminomutase